MPYGKNKVGLINQAPTKYQNPINSYEKNNKVGLINQSSTEYKKCMELMSKI